MRSLLRYSLVAVGTLALLTIGFVTFRARLEQKVQGQTPAQVSGCNATLAPSRTNPCLVISSFRHNGPGGTADEFVEIFNASTINITVSALSDDPTPANGIGVFVSAGHGFNTLFGQAANVSSLACQIPGSTVIAGRHWFLCTGTAYTLGARGINSGTTHSTGDMVIGSGTASTGTNNIPDDAGMALLNLGSNISTQCVIGSLGCPTGFNFSALSGSGNAVVLDKVGFDPYGPGSPANTGPGVYPGNIYPSLAAQYCEGKCLSPVGDASVIPLGPAIPCPTTVTPTNPLYTIAGPSGQHDTVFPVVDGGFIRQADGTFSSTHKCYGESGQYKIERRRSGQTFTASAGDIHRDSWNSITSTCTASPAPAVCGNADDFILDTPNPASANVGQTESGISAVKSVLGSAAPHNLSAPAPLGQTQFTQDAFDTCSGAIIPCTPGQLGPRNAERRYAQDPNILGTNNDVFGTFIIRHRFVNATPSVTGVRWRIDDISGLCGGQTGTAGTTSEVATQEARNLRLPNASVPPGTTPVPSCQGEGSDSGAFTALLKAVNHYGEVVVDSSGTARIVWGTVLEDVFIAPSPQPATGALQPFGGGGNGSFVLNSTAVGSATPYVVGAGPSAITNIGDGVSGGTGSFTVPTMSSAATNTIRVAFKFGVVKSGRFKLLLGREVATSATPLP
jgi:hypothetical protein